MAAWVVRGGKDGERENVSLDKGVLTIDVNWSGELSEPRTKEDVKRSLEQMHPDVKAKTISSWTGQVWTFIDHIKAGDLIVMPRKGQPTIAIGKWWEHFTISQNPLKLLVEQSSG